MLVKIQLNRMPRDSNGSNCLPAFYLRFQSRVSKAGYFIGACVTPTQEPMARRVVAGTCKEGLAQKTSPLIFIPNFNQATERQLGLSKFMVVKYSDYGDPVTEDIDQSCSSLHTMTEN